MFRTEMNRGSEDVVIKGNKPAGNLWWAPPALWFLCPSAGTFRLRQDQAAPPTSSSDLLPLHLAAVKFNKQTKLILVYLMYHRGYRVSWLGWWANQKLNSTSTKRQSGHIFTSEATCREMHEVTGSLALYWGLITSPSRCGNGAEHVHV